MKKMMIVMVVFSSAIALLGAFFVQDIIGWVTGIFLGLVISLLKLKLMENTFNKAMSMPEDKAKSYTQRHYMARYALTGLVLLVAVLTPRLNIMGVFVGLISMKIGAYSELYTRKN